MNENILALEPKLLWKNFRKLTLIPHPSKHEEEITKMLVEFGKQFADETFQDEIGNVIFRKNATPGFENRKVITLQAHCDMVPQKNVDKKHDFLKDPITTKIEGEFVMADGTTLGADDGIGVAAIMAVFEDNSLKHGPIEGLITVDEETAITGAAELKPNILKGEILLNLDSEEDNIFYIGCAGGCNIDINKKLDFEEVTEEYKSYKLKVSGFLGGHSGADIHKNRPNPIKLIVRFLNNIDYIKLGNIEGGNMHNAIPRESEALIFVKDNDIEKLEKSIKEFQEILNSEYGKSDPDGKITIEKCDDDSKKCLTEESFKATKYAINTLVSGVYSMSADMPGLVETSNNLSIVKVENSELKILCLMRSSVQSQTEYFKDIVKAQMEIINAECIFSNEYPGWKPNPDSEILKISEKIYENNFNEKPFVTAIHAGLECGIIIGKYPNMDAISLGPTMYGVHTPTEKVEIKSTEKFMKLIENIIENAPIKK